jgi:exonuclease SbcC
MKSSLNGQPTVARRSTHFMATFYYEMAIGNAGHSLAKFEYITRTGKYQYSASGEIKEDLIYKESSNMPSWASGKTDGGYDMKSATFWNEADLSKEKVPFKQITMALPNELSYEENIAIMQQYMKTHFEGYPYTMAIHDKEATLTDGERNIHAHIMFSERKIDLTREEPDRISYFKRSSVKKDGTKTGGYLKSREFKPKEKLIELRKNWESIINEEYRKRGMKERVSCEKLEVQRAEALANKDFLRAAELDRPAQKKMNPSTVYKNAQTIKSFKQYLFENKFDEAQFLISITNDDSLKSYLLCHQYMDLKKRIARERFLSKDDLKTVEKAESLQSTLSTKLQEAKTFNSKVGTTATDGDSIHNRIKRLEERSKRIEEEITNINSRVITQSELIKRYKKQQATKRIYKARLLRNKRPTTFKPSRITSVPIRTQRLQTNISKEALIHNLYKQRYVFNKATFDSTCNSIMNRITKGEYRKQIERLRSLTAKYNKFKDPSVLSDMKQTERWLSQKKEYLLPKIQKQAAVELDTMKRSVQRIDRNLEVLTSSDKSLYKAYKEVTRTDKTHKYKEAVLRSYSLHPNDVNRLHKLQNRLESLTNKIDSMKAVRSVETTARKIERLEKLQTNVTKKIQTIDTSVPMDKVGTITKHDVFEAIKQRKADILAELRPLRQEYAKYDHKKVTYQSTLNSVMNRITKGEYKRNIEVLRSLKQKQSLAFKQQEKARFEGNTSDMNRYSAESAAYTKEMQKVEAWLQSTYAKLNTPTIQQQAMREYESINQRNQNVSEQIHRLETDYKHLDTLKKKLYHYGNSNSNVNKQGTSIMKQFLKRGTPQSRINGLLKRLHNLTNKVTANDHAITAHIKFTKDKPKWRERSIEDGIEI